MFFEIQQPVEPCCKLLVASGPIKSYKRHAFAFTLVCSQWDVYQCDCAEHRFGIKLLNFGLKNSCSLDAVPCRSSLNGTLRTTMSFEFCLAILILFLNVIFDFLILFDRETKIFRRLRNMCREIMSSLINLYSSKVQSSPSCQTFCLLIL